MVVLLLIFVFEVKAKINPHGPTVVNDLTNCISGLVEINFNETGFIIFANANNVSTSVEKIRSSLLSQIHSKLKFSAQVKSPTNQPPVCEQNDDENADLPVAHRDVFEVIPIANYFIVIIDDYEDFTYVASRIIRSRNWNPQAKFIIVFLHFAIADSVNKKLVEQMLTCMFKYNVVNIIVVVPEKDNFRNAIVYGWRPYDPPKYCGYFNETANNRLRVENVCERGVVKYREKNFERRLPVSMKGCVLQILALERQPFVSSNADDPNIERYFINQLADIYDIKTEYNIITGFFRGERNDTGHWDGALRELSAKKGHILLGGIFPDYDVHEDFECSNTYLADSYTWVVPRANYSPKYIALFIIFKSTVWYCVVAGYFICVLSWKVIGSFSEESLYHKVWGHCFLNTWISHVGFCAYSRPVKDSLRVFYVFFNIYCILFLTGYQTKLINVLTNPTFEEQIDTIEELVESGLKFGGFEELHDLFFNSSDPFDYMLGEKWHDVINLTHALVDVTVHRNFSVLCSRLELAHMASIMPELSSSSGEDKYFAFEQNMFSVPMEMVALKGFAFMPRFSHILETFKQLGVNSGVKKYFANLNMRKRAALLRSLAGEHSDINPLSLQHLQGGFLALTLGVVGGAAALLIEIIINSEHVTRQCSGCRRYFSKNSRKRQ